MRTQWPGGQDRPAQPYARYRVAGPCPRREHRGRTPCVRGPRRRARASTRARCPISASRSPRRARTSSSTPTARARADMEVEAFVDGRHDRGRRPRRGLRDPARTDSPGLGLGLPLIAALAAVGEPRPRRARPHRGAHDVRPAARIAERLLGAGCHGDRDPLTRRAARAQPRPRARRRRPARRSDPEPRRGDGRHARRLPARPHARTPCSLSTRSPPTAPRSWSTDAWSS